MIQDKIKKCNLSEEDRMNLEIILNGGDLEFVEQYLKETKMTMNAVKNLPTEEICKDYDLGMGVGEIAKKYDCSVASVRNHLIKGGYKWNASEQKYFKNSDFPMGITVNRKKNMQRRVVNWMIDSGFKEEHVFTVEKIADQFEVSRDAASGILSEIVKKGIMGLERIGKGLYKIGNSANYQNVEKHSVPTIQNEEKIHNVDHMDMDNMDNMDNMDAALNNFRKVANLAKELGSLDNLISIANALKLI